MLTVLLGVFSKVNPLWIVLVFVVVVAVAVLAKRVPRGRRGAGAGDEALDLGSTVLPVLLRSYGPKVGAGLVVLLLVVLAHPWASRAWS